jgi:hypothetical protein
MPHGTSRATCRICLSLAVSWPARKRKRERFIDNSCFHGERIAKVIASHLADAATL